MGSGKRRQVTASPGAPFWRQTLENDVVQIAHDPGKRVHALIDGAFFDDLPKLLADNDLAARPLFTGNTPQALVNAGPWLVDLHSLPFAEPDDSALPGDVAADEAGLTDEALEAQAAAMADAVRQAVEAGDETGGLAPPPDEDAWVPGPPADPATQIRALMNLAGEKSALIFWIGGADLTFQRLFKHLRSLNMVLVPKDGGDADDGAQPAPDKPGSSESKTVELEAVQFRHADGNVLASVLPVLNEPQFARLFGPALALTFHAPDFPDEDGWPVRRAVHPLTAQAPAGMLALTVEQYAQLTIDRVRKNRQFTMGYLRDAAPDETKDMREGELYRFVCRAEKSGFALGLESDYAHGLWAFFLISFGEHLAENPEITDPIRNSDDPDTAMEDLLNELAEGSAEDEEQR